MIAIVDANIALALMLDLAYSEKARTAVEAASSMAAPSLILAESANALWKITAAEPSLTTRSRQIMTQLPLILDSIEEDATLAPHALMLAQQLNHPAYDCFYLALAQIRSGTLITADRKLAAAACRMEKPPQLFLVEA